jgi:hypothetical protein
LGHARVGIVAGLVALALPAPAGAKLAELPSANVIVALERNGVLDVIEQVTVRADGPTAARYEITMQKGELFAEPSLRVNDRRYRAGDGRRPGTFQVSRGTRGIRFDWRQPDGRGSIRLGYRLALLGTAYTDVVDLRVPVWERDWEEPVQRLTAALKLPRAARGRVLVWVEPESLAAKIGETRHEILLQVRDVPAGAGVTLRTVLPRKVLSSFTGVNVKTKPGLATILADRRGGTGGAWWPWAVVAGGALGVSAVALRTVRSRRPRLR